jgi:hypothetical protein
MTEEVTFHVSRLPQMGDNPAVMIATPCDVTIKGAMHTVLIELTDTGFVGRDVCDRGAPSPNVRRALREYIETAWQCNKNVPQHGEWMIATYLPEFERSLDRVTTMVVLAFDGYAPNGALLDLDARLNEERRAGRTVRCLTVPHSEVAMHLKVAGFVMWGAERGTNAVQLIDFRGRSFSAPITRSEAGWPTPNVSPGSREALDGYATWLLEIVGKDRSEVEGRSRDVAKWLIADLMHGYPGILPDALRVFEDES